MKYISVNELDYFSFHDAQLKKLEYQDGKMTWILDGVNATIENSQNSFPTDMSVKDAELIFKQAKVIKIEFDAYKVFDSNNVLMKSVDSKEAKPDEYDEILSNTVNSYSYLFSFDILPQQGEMYRICVNIEGGAGCYSLTLAFSKSIVSWDEFSGKAWYEDEK